VSRNIIIDEAQDLEPSVIAVLRSLLKPEGELFVTADAHQSIYGSSFRWSDAHNSLVAHSSISTLHANFRSTREIATAAFSYVKGAVIDDISIEQIFLHEGPAPALRTVKSQEEVLALLEKFIQAAFQRGVNTRIDRPKT
jgi:superfamily I DNA/RNA helicase